MVDRLGPWDVQVYGTDPWATEASIIPQDQQGQRPATTPEIERNHCRQRTGLAASNASRSLSPRQKRWWISPWACSRGFGSMETRMSFYHYLIESSEVNHRGLSQRDVVEKAQGTDGLADQRPGSVLVV